VAGGGSGISPCWPNAVTAQQRTNATTNPAFSFIVCSFAGVASRGSLLTFDQGDAIS
jgi:hypothetical protein